MGIDWRDFRTELAVGGVLLIGSLVLLLIEYSWLKGTIRLRILDGLTFVWSLLFVQFTIRVWHVILAVLGISTTAAGVVYLRWGGQLFSKTVEGIEVKNVLWDAKIRDGNVLSLSSPKCPRCKTQLHAEAFFELAKCPNESCRFQTRLGDFSYKQEVKKAIEGRINRGELDI